MSKLILALLKKHFNTVLWLIMAAIDFFFIKDEAVALFFLLILVVLGGWKFMERCIDERS